MDSGLEMIGDPRLRLAERDNEEGAPVTVTTKVKIVGAIIVGFIMVVGVATLAISAYSIYQAYQFDYANHKAMVQIIQYNLQQGKILPVPSPPPPVPPAASSEPKK